MAGRPSKFHKKIEGARTIFIQSDAGHAPSNSNGHRRRASVAPEPRTITLASATGHPQQQRGVRYMVKGRAPPVAQVARRQARPAPAAAPPPLPPPPPVVSAGQLVLRRAAGGRLVLGVGGAGDDGGELVLQVPEDSAGQQLVLQDESGGQLILQMPDGDISAQELVVQEGSGGQAAPEPSGNSPVVLQDAQAVSGASQGGELVLEDTQSARPAGQPALVPADGAGEPVVLPHQLGAVSGEVMLQVPAGDQHQEVVIQQESGDQVVLRLPPGAAGPDGLIRLVQVTAEDGSVQYIANQAEAQSDPAASTPGEAPQDASAAPQPAADAADVGTLTLDVTSEGVVTAVAAPEAVRSDPGGAVEASGSEESSGPGELGAGDSSAPADQPAQTSAQEQPPDPDPSSSVPTTELLPKPEPDAAPSEQAEPSPADAVKTERPSPLGGGAEREVQPAAAESVEDAMERLMGADQQGKQATSAAPSPAPRPPPQEPPPGDEAPHPDPLSTCGQTGTPHHQTAGASHQTASPSHQTASPSHQTPTPLAKPGAADGLVCAVCGEVPRAASLSSLGAAAVRGTQMALAAALTECLGVKWREEEGQLVCVPCEVLVGQGLASGPLQTSARDHLCNIWALSRGQPLLESGAAELDTAAPRHGARRSHSKARRGRGRPKRGRRTSTAPRTTEPPAEDATAQDPGGGGRAGDSERESGRPEQQGGSKEEERDGEREEREESQGEAVTGGEDSGNVKAKADSARMNNNTGENGAKANSNNSRKDSALGTPSESDPPAESAPASHASPDGSPERAAAHTSTDDAGVTVMIKLEPEEDPGLVKRTTSGRRSRAPRAWSPDEDLAPRTRPAGDGPGRGRKRARDPAALTSAAKRPKQRATGQGSAGAASGEAAEGRKAAAATASSVAGGKDDAPALKKKRGKVGIEKKGDLDEAAKKSKKGAVEKQKEKSIEVAGGKGEKGDASNEETKQPASEAAAGKNMPGTGKTSMDIVSKDGAENDAVKGKPAEGSADQTQPPAVQKTAPTGESTLTAEGAPEKTSALGDSDVEKAKDDRSRPQAEDEKGTGEEGEHGATPITQEGVKATSASGENASDTIENPDSTSSNKATRVLASRSLSAQKKTGTAVRSKKPSPAKNVSETGVRGKRSAPSQKRAAAGKKPAPSGTRGGGTTQRRANARVAERRGRHLRSAR